MKTIAIFGALAVLTIGACTAEVPNLVGNWAGSQNAYQATENGSYKQVENMSTSLIIAAQKDRLFTGNITFTLNQTEIVEAFAGAIGLDNKTFNIAEFNEGYDFGTIISDNEIEMVYLDDGKSGWVSIEKFHRVTNATMNIG